MPNPNIAIFHCAIILIIHTGYVYRDRLVEEEHILASLKHFIMSHAAILPMSSVYGKQYVHLLSLYILVKQDYLSLGTPGSVEVEHQHLLVLIIQKNDYGALNFHKTQNFLRNWTLAGRACLWHQPWRLGL